MTGNDSPDYRTFEEGFEDEDIDRQEYSFLPPRLMELENARKVAALEPAERIERLLENMYAHKRFLLSAISACMKPCSFRRVSQVLDDLRVGEHSVFSPENYLNMLVDAGALEMVTAEGEPYVQVQAGPLEVKRNGMVYLEVVEPPEPYWRATDAGLEAVRTHDPLGEIKQLFAERASFHPSFAILLGLCSREGGADIKVLKEAINDRPEMVEKKKTAQFLLDCLVNAGALYYDADRKGWRTNDIGGRALRMLEASER